MGWLPAYREASMEAAKELGLWLKLGTEGRGVKMKRLETPMPGP